MRTTDVAIIGAGQAGLAMSRCLARRGIAHVVIERGRIAERWRSERWESLRLLTPNWMSRLPGWSYSGPDPEGYMTMPEITGHLCRYARAMAAPVEEGCAVHAVRMAGERYRIETGRGTWTARGVVIATGQCDTPQVPTIARALPPAIRQLTPSSYRRAAALPPGGVLIVGASASGVQLAEEISRSGRTVFLAAGRHTRLPRRYRGRDILDWMERLGVLGETAAEMRDLWRARGQPSLQLIGSPDGRSLDLASLQARGVRLLGRLNDIDDGRLHFADDLADSTAAAQGTLGRMLARVDRLADAEGAAREAWPMPFAPGPTPTQLDPIAARIRTVIWATGFSRDYRWLQLPVLDGAGEIRHDGGITPLPGVYALGLPFMRTRRSSFIDGVGADAEALAAHLHDFLDTTGRVAA